MIHPPWVTLYFMAHSFIELHKPLCYNKAVICEGDRHELGQTSGGGERERGLVSFSPWGHKESDTTGQLNNSNHILSYIYVYMCVCVYDTYVCMINIYVWYIYVWYICLYTYVYIIHIYDTYIYKQVALTWFHLPLSSYALWNRSHQWTQSSSIAIV